MVGGFDRATKCPQSPKNDDYLHTDALKTDIDGEKKDTSTGSAGGILRNFRSFKDLQEAVRDLLLGGGGGNNNDINCSDTDNNKKKGKKGKKEEEEAAEKEEKEKEEERTLSPSLSSSSSSISIAAITDISPCLLTASPSSTSTEGEDSVEEEDFVVVYSATAVKEEEEENEEEKDTTSSSSSLRQEDHILTVKKQRDSSTDGNSTPRIVEATMPGGEESMSNNNNSNSSSILGTCTDKIEPEVIRKQNQKLSLNSKTVMRDRNFAGQIMSKTISVEENWREKLSLVMLQENSDGSPTPIKIIKDLSNALSIECTEDKNSIEIRAYEWQELKEAEALLRLTFRDYDGVAFWWFYTIPTFVSCIISGTKGTEVPEFSNPSIGLKCSIAPYDENSTRRAFFLTCPERAPVDLLYARIKRGWNYWRFQSLEKQINRALGVLYEVSMVSIKADGNCLFRSFAKSLLKEEERHVEVRQVIVDFMRTCEELKFFIAPDEVLEEDDEEATKAYVEKYFDEMEKPGTWGDQVEITAFTKAYRRAVRVFSYNYSECRLVCVPTLLEPGVVPEGPEVWLLHLHGHYSLLAPGVAPPDAKWEKMLREYISTEGEGEGEGE